MSGGKRVLVTGGAGFVGSHLCFSLLELGFEVICLDNLFTGSLDNIAEISEHPAFRFVQHDVGIPSFHQTEQVYNLACPASPVHYQFNAVETVRTNVLGTMNMLDLCKQTGAVMLQASTSEIYGDPEVHPQPETYWGNVNPLGPRACYDEGKRVAETLCMDYHRQHGVNIKIVRIFNTYGPNMADNDGRVVSNFVTQALRGAPITLYGSGEQTRSFCFVSDLVEGLIRMMERSDPAEVGPVNLGNAQETTMRELAELIVELTNSNSSIEYLPLPQDDPRRRQPDISKAKRLLDWEPSVSLRLGLLQTIEYFASKRNRCQGDVSLGAQSLPT